MDKQRNFYKDVLLGVAVGDALGVPVEFKSRESIAQMPVNDMAGFGTHDQPPGTWSDDSSLTFCLADVLADNYDLQKIADSFVGWLYDEQWTAHGEVFDVGFATRNAIERVLRKVRPDLAGGFEVSSNGNGSLMRILPLLFYIKDKPINERFAITKAVSSITHAHVRSVIACFYYLEFAGKLLTGNDRFITYHELKNEVSSFLNSTTISPDEILLFNRLLKENIYELPEAEIQSSGYVLHTLEASIWCLLNTSNYAEAVLKAVNLGLDTDTTGAVTGGLAALCYSHETIPEHWKLMLARNKDIEALADRLANKYERNN
ncbi:ADP-ribosylglycohydrolase [Mucilaginibacter oryzae]|uniref:ADP-ribosylglycohydrolase n=1 Tax=Mucilaginibacter oryzae TaxID=468058 RepID=A0A316HHM2_9SPHI|nr:ADP-ribosylglycohydrolase family protein [Mucilaginibacter oryzae]PWK77755.1 ADP-ribosylglycohydrolase [Mucilaginibacter oryzae]